MKLSEIKGEAALDALADLIEPATEIMTDVHFVKCIKDNNRVKAVKLAIKNHKKAIITILAVLDGKKPEEYEVNILTLPSKLMELANDPDVVSLFQLQGTVTSSGSAMENTEEEKT